MKTEIRRGRKAERRYIVTPDQAGTRKKLGRRVEGDRSTLRPFRLRAVYQKVNFTPSCISRGAWAAFSVPNDTLRISVSKPTKFVWFRRLKNSARNWNP